MKKILQTMCLSGMALLLLSACVQMDSNVTNQSTSVQSTEESVKIQVPTVWNETKAKELETLMKSWSVEQGHTYESYSPDNNVNFYGSEIPESLISEEVKLSFNQKTLNLEWSKDGQGEYPYQLIAVYSDSEMVRYADKEVYFFMIHNGKPIIYETIANQDTPVKDKVIQLKEVENRQLVDGFERIVNE